MANLSGMWPQVDSLCSRNEAILYIYIYIYLLNNVIMEQPILFMNKGMFSTDCIKFNGEKELVNPSGQKIKMNLDIVVTTKKIIAQ